MLIDCNSAEADYHESNRDGLVYSLNLPSSDKHGNLLVQVVSVVLQDLGALSG